MRFSLSPFLQSVGVLLVSFGLIREGFGEGLPPAPVVAGGAHATDGLHAFFAQAQEGVLHFGGKIGLLPTEHAISVAERHLDAECAIVGFLLLVIVGILEFVRGLRGR